MELFCLLQKLTQILIRTKVVFQTEAIKAEQNVKQNFPLQLSLPEHLSNVISYQKGSWCRGSWRTLTARAPRSSQPPANITALEGIFTKTVSQNSAKAAHINSKTLPAYFAQIGTTERKQAENCGAHKMAGAETAGAAVAPEEAD